VASLDNANRTAAGLSAQFDTYFSARLRRIQLGGDETTGQGFVAVNLLAKEGLI
jgi:CRISPR/Cas system CMR subunit Cmr4 (Cas7 group RAMP superfamily)